MTILGWHGSVNLCKGDHTPELVQSNPCLKRAIPSGEGYGLSSMKRSTAQSLGIWRTDRNAKRTVRCANCFPIMNVDRAMVLVLVSAVLATMSVQAISQSLSLPDISSANESSTLVKPHLTYVRPTTSAMVKHYAFDAFGPYALAFTALTAGLDQATNTPPEWKQGFGAYAERFGSDFGIAAVGTTARYGTAAVFRDDTSYYRCECKGARPRLGHAVFSTLTARRAQNGHRVFSFPALIAPYIGSMVGVYGWYPSRYGIKDALRMGNYSLLESAGTNIALEFLYKGPQILFSRMHLNHLPGAPDSGPKP